MVDRTVRRLLETGDINQQQLQAALEEQLISNDSIVDILVKKGFITEAGIKDSLELSELDNINVRELQISPGILKMIPVHIIRNNKVFPLKFENNKFVLAMVDPKDLITKDTVNIVLGKSINLQRFKISEEDYFFLINKYIHILGDLREKEREAAEAASQEEQSIDPKDDSTTGQVDRFIQRLFTSALQKRASLITVEPGSDHVRIRFKIDDTFYEESRLPKKMYPNFLIQIKTISGLESEEKNFYFCGNFKFTDTDKKEYNFVINSIKTINGEKLIIRPGYPVPDLKSLFYYPGIYEYLDSVTANNKGMILVIGGAGSGKSTTLYSLLQHKISNRFQLMTIEDPIKYVFENYVSQIQLKTDKISSLSDLVSEVGKHNPDVLLVQEIKDELWCELIEELALSGMLILTSMRAYNTISALKRLKRMNYPNFASIQCIVNQKLLKKLCPFCKVECVPTAEELHSVRATIGQIPDAYKADPSGCSKCVGGYKELIGIFEIIKVSRELVDLFANNDYFGAEIGKIINDSCIMNFKEYCIKLLIDGIISFDEIKKLT
jgi:type IV pilus assembly protein PilB